MASSSLIKTILHKSLAEGVYRDVTTKSSNYYYFLGKTLEWAEEATPPYPIDSYAYERAVRNDIITMKQIGPSDVCFVIPRINWVSGEIYDMYDDEYSNEIIGIDIVSGGSGYNTLPTITITGGGGTGAKYYPKILDGQIIDIEYDFAVLEAAGITDSSRGTGYTSVPTVTVTGGGGSGADLRAVLNLAASGENNLEDSQFYVMTDTYNVYKCIDNNNNSLSTIKPTGTSVAPISTTDGYVWKYMFNVPINLRNKFLDQNYIPVTSALTNQFYSNGTVDNVIITNKGTGYTSAFISVQGNGYRQEDPAFITGVKMNNKGSGYTDPTIIFTDPVPSASIFNLEANVFLGQQIYTEAGDFYEVTAPGILSDLSAPSHRYGIVQNGTAALKFLGSRVKGTAVLDGGIIDSITLIGLVREIEIDNGGLGYINPPSITFTGGDGVGAAAVAKMNQANGSVLYCTVTNPGDNYSSDPDVVFGDAWTSTTAVTIGEQYFVSNRLYTVTGNGTTGSIAPTHVSLTVDAGDFIVGAVYTIATVGTTDFTDIGASSNTVGVTFTATDVGSGTGTATTSEAMNGTARLSYVGYPASGTVIRRYGYGYSDAPTVTITDEDGEDAVAIVDVVKSEAKLLPVVDNGQIVGVIAENPGIGYSDAKLIVSGDGIGATLSADLSLGNIQSLQANNEILSTAGTIDAIKLISGGYGYGGVSVEIQGDGSGATANATVDTASGRITKINITSQGSGYTFANVIINGNGKGAKARAIMPPFSGHGKNAPDELYSRTLVFYSNVSTDLNQGLKINNDYRQIGIIKNPRSYLSNNRYNNVIGSSCFLVQVTYNTDISAFPKDTDVTVVRNINEEDFERRYRIVTATQTSILLQSLDNDTPLTNDTFKNPTGETFNVLSVSNPTVDKYSGQMMFIDNKAGFTPSNEETVTLRTIIKF